jgi:hypothetical protein
MLLIRASILIIPLGWGKFIHSQRQISDQEVEMTLIRAAVATNEVEIELKNTEIVRLQVMKMCPFDVCNELMGHVERN